MKTVHVMFVCGMAEGHRVGPISEVSLLTPAEAEAHKAYVREYLSEHLDRLATEDAVEMTAEEASALKASIRVVMHNTQLVELPEDSRWLVNNAREAWEQQHGKIS